MLEDPAEELQDFDRLMQIYRPAVFRFLLASLRNRDEAESLTQDCFLKAFRHRNQFRGESAVKTWLMQIAANLVRDVTRCRKFQFWRRIQQNVSATDLINSLSSRDASPEATTITRDQVEAIWSAVSKLPGRQREVFLLRFVEDMNLSEIATVLGTTEGSVKKHLFRGLESVREKTRRLR
jgi:RNA polymerase sigma-70 factor (ECF subfamily)